MSSTWKQMPRCGQGHQLEGRNCVHRWRAHKPCGKKRPTGGRRSLKALSTSERVLRARLGVRNAIPVSRCQHDFGIMELGAWMGSPSRTKTRHLQNHSEAAQGDRYLSDSALYYPQGIGALLLVAFAK